jgi:hypothetical protein
VGDVAILPKEAGRATQVSDTSSQWRSRAGRITQCGSALTAERGGAMDDHGYEDVAKLAYRFWEDRGRPMGSPEVDWYRAEQEVEASPQVMRSLYDIALGAGW